MSNEEGKEWVPWVSPRGSKGRNGLVESFEHLCKVALEAEGFVVTGNVKFFVRRQTRKAAYEEYQEHGYEVDLIAARGNRLLLAEVKSYLGSTCRGRRPIHLANLRLLRLPEGPGRPA